ncbi:hypothetical protein COV20_03455 [Candidatus Woesearchaeota archaeon CG10_big_fil_rev_8_21_14_0_10_45_16]|nr:MAG: hypothetical protein COV20_03455 [Candidatus Woesearchaeota archaeon CG10_big_fil_rev_8_21_14_0_10_45_16]
MKLTYTTKNQRLQVEIDSDSVKETFKKLAEFQEVFDESCCQLCHNEDLQFVVRTVDGNDYYELKCRKCFAKLAFGQHKTGGSLFPKRKNDDGSFDKEGKGWHKWNGKSD